MTHSEAIWHLVKDARDPSWEGWDVYDETGRWRGGVDTLNQARFCYGVKLHRGLHPDEAQRAGVEFLSPEDIRPGKWRVYWFVNPLDK